MCLAGIGLVDQTNEFFVPAYAQSAASFRSDENFVRRIEEKVAPGAMIYQLPFMPFPEGPPGEMALLRGYLHAGAAVVAALGGTYLVVLSSGDRPRQLSMLVYGAGLTVLFAFSAVYHLRTWAPVREAILRRIDHALPSYRACLGPGEVVDG